MSFDDSSPAAQEAASIIATIIHFGTGCYPNLKQIGHIARQLDTEDVLLSDNWVWLKKLTMKAK